MLLVESFAAEQEKPGSRDPQALQAQVLSCKLSHLAEPNWGCSENGISEICSAILHDEGDAQGCNMQMAPRSSWRTRESTAGRYPVAVPGKELVNME